jgi:hypothetical protein
MFDEKRTFAWANDVRPSIQYSSRMSHLHIELSADKEEDGSLI